MFFERSFLLLECWLVVCEYWLSPLGVWRKDLWRYTISAPWLGKESVHYMILRSLTHRSHKDSDRLLVIAEPPDWVGQTKMENGPYSQVMHRDTAAPRPPPPQLLPSFGC